jgi:hypothetical protein
MIEIHFRLVKILKFSEEMFLKKYEISKNIIFSILEKLCIDDGMDHTHDMD